MLNQAMSGTADAMVLSSFGVRAPSVLGRRMAEEPVRISSRPMIAGRPARIAIGISSELNSTVVISLQLKSPCRLPASFL